MDDLIDGIYRLMMTNYHEPVNIGNPNEISIKDLADLVNNLIDNPAGVNVQSAYRFDNDPQRRKPDISRAKSILGWEPKISFHAGLMATLPYFKQKMQI